MNGAFQNLPSDERISDISTAWSMVFQAHEATSDQASKIRAQLLERYCGAIYRYIKSVVGSPEVVEELCQEFALRFARGVFRNADPAKGRFRDFVKASVINLVHDYHRQESAKKPTERLHSSILIQRPASGRTEEEEFQKHWTEELLLRSWNTLQDFENESGTPVYTMLRFRASHSELSSEESARQMTVALDRPVSAALFRQTIHRAREKFAHALIDEVGKAICSNVLSEIRDELAELGLLIYCEPAFKQGAP